MAEEGLKAKEKLNHVIIDSVENSIDKLPDNYFDVIYFNDVLEHLANPNSVLVNIRAKLSEAGVIISSIPNVRYHSVFKQYIFKKDWKYDNAGVMDFTHLRFFTSKSIKDMYHEAGYEIVKHKGINKTRSLMPYFYNILLLFTAGDMFYVQYATIAKKAGSVVT
jgi:2-polyprenyl-3-methyl-5-hydroxy-6-metoxy-1,4-benzoquinol methylase